MRRRRVILSSGMAIAALTALAIVWIGIARISGGVGKSPWEISEESMKLSMSWLAERSAVTSLISSGEACPSTATTLCSWNSLWIAALNSTMTSGSPSLMELGMVAMNISLWNQSSERAKIGKNRQVGLGENSAWPSDCSVILVEAYNKQRIGELPP